MYLKFNKPPFEMKAAVQSSVHARLGAKFSS